MPIPYTWGTVPQELHLPFPCDNYLEEPHTAYYRGITVNAPPEILFPWLCQMRVAPEDGSRAWTTSPSVRA